MESWRGSDLSWAAGSVCYRLLSAQAAPVSLNGPRCCPAQEVSASVPEAVADSGQSPGLDEGAVDAEMFVGDQFLPFGKGQHAPEKQAADVLVEQAVAVGAEGGVVPEALLHKPSAEQTSPIPQSARRTWGMATVTGVPNRVNRFNSAARIWSRAAWL